MQITFSNEELKNISIEFNSETNLPVKYTNIRDEHWSKLKKKYNNEGRSLWNGEVYYLKFITQTELSNPVINLGTCEYKDIVIRKKMGRDTIVKKFGTKALPNYITVDLIPVTNDGYMVFGLRNSSTSVSSGKIGLVGGTLNKDELKVKKYEDIKRMGKLELKEELGIEEKLSKFKFVCINKLVGRSEFIYEVVLNKSSSDIEKLENISEFSELVLLNKEDYKKYKGDSLYAFDYVKNYLNRIDCA